MLLGAPVIMLQFLASRNDWFVSYDWDLFLPLNLFFPFIIQHHQTQSHGLQ